MTTSLRDSGRAHADTVRAMDAVDWASLSDQELLERRISRLGLRLDGTPVEPLIWRLYEELSSRNLSLPPAVSHRR